MREPERSRSSAIGEGDGIGWEAGTRTPIHWSRASCPTIERPPSRSRDADYLGMRPRGSNAGRVRR